MEAAPKLEVPEKIGSFEILEEIGRGGMGYVYRARHKDGTIVALKMLATHLTDRDIQRERFFREAEIASRLDHPNIVRAIESGEEDGRIYFAMEYVEGIHLGQYIRESGKMPEEDAVRIVIEVARALHKAHKEGLVHRDVKPDNVMITKDGQVKLADLGLVKELNSDQNLTQADQGLGSPFFMAPEQFRNAVGVDCRCDVYALGQLLYILVTGKLPFKGGSTVDTFLQKTRNEYIRPDLHTPGLHDRTVQAICKAIDPYPDNRPPTVRDWVEVLTGRSTGRHAGADAEVVDDETVSEMLASQNTVKTSLPERRPRRPPAIEEEERDVRLTDAVCSAISEEYPVAHYLWRDRIVMIATTIMGLLLCGYALTIAM